MKRNTFAGTRAWWTIHRGQLITHIIIAAIGTFVGGLAVAGFTGQFSGDTDRESQAADSESSSQDGGSNAESSSGESKSESSSQSGDVSGTSQSGATGGRAQVTVNIQGQDTGTAKDTSDNDQDSAPEQIEAEQDQQGAEQESGGDDADDEPSGRGADSSPTSRDDGDSGTSEEDSAGESDSGTSDESDQPDSPPQTPSNGMPTPTISLTVVDGEQVFRPGTGEVYVVKIVGDERYKRHFITDRVRDTYGHLIGVEPTRISQEEFDSFTISCLVRFEGTYYFFDAREKEDEAAKHLITDDWSDLAAAGISAAMVFEVHGLEINHSAFVPGGDIGAAEAVRKICGAS